MKPVAWRYENKNVKGIWYITWTEPPDGFNKRPLYEHLPQDAANSCLFPMQEAAKDLERQLSIRDAEIAELRQQLADRDEQISDLTISSDTYFAERNSARDVWRRASKDRDELRQQLAMFKSAVEHVTEDGCLRRSFVAMPEGWAMVHKDRLHALELAEEQLAATDGLDQYILCEKEPVVWMQSDHLSRFVHHACGAQSALVRCSDHQLMPDFQPLYRAMKVRVAREKNAKNC